MGQCWQRNAPEKNIMARLFTYERRDDEYSDWEWAMDSDEKIENAAQFDSTGLDPEQHEVRRQPENANGEPNSWEYFDLVEDRWLDASA